MSDLGGNDIHKFPWHQKLLLKKEIKAKCHTFRQQGYLAIDEKELLQYVLSYRWKTQAPSTFKQCREDIAAIKANDFFDYQQIKAQTSNLSLEDWDDIEDLF